ncbi:MAG: SCO family protein, partial [Roseicyclus sp.]
MTRTYAIISAALIGALLIGAAVAVMLGQTAQRADGDPFGQCRASNVAGGAGSIGGPFTLVSETGETVTDQDVVTQPSLLYFGY